MLSLEELLLDILEPILDKVLILLILRDDIGNIFGDMSEINKHSDIRLWDKKHGSVHTLYSDVLKMELCIK